MSAEAAVTLTACIIAMDEERDLPDCLASVAFCDEVVVVDSGSTDRTIAVAEAAGARVVHQDWLGFAAQRNVAIDAARGTWILEVDADERVTPELRAEIQAFVAAPPEGVDLVGIPRREVLVDRALGASAKYPNYCHRLLRRGSYRHDERRTVHEGLVPHGPVVPFQGELAHYYAPTWRAAFDDARNYGRLEYEQLAAPRTPRTVAKGAVARPLAKLGYRLVVDGGWRDGPIGAARIALDCATDALVWLRYARRGPAGTPGHGVARGHYGSRRLPMGSLHLVVVAALAGDVAQAAAWATRAAAAGHDVALLSPGVDAPVSVRHRPLEGTGLLATIRALDAEEQLRTIDAVVTAGPRARRWLKLTPGSIRGFVPPVDSSVEPAELERLVLAAREVYSRPD